MKNALFSMICKAGELITAITTKRGIFNEINGINMRIFDITRHCTEEKNILLNHTHVYGICKLGLQVRCQRWRGLDQIRETCV